MLHILCFVFLDKERGLEDPKDSSIKMAGTILQKAPYTTLAL
jgi:hypothetical protein